MKTFGRAFELASRFKKEESVVLVPPRGKVSSLKTKGTNWSKYRRDFIHSPRNF